MKHTEPVEKFNLGPPNSLSLQLPQQRTPTKTTSYEKLRSDEVTVPRKRKRRRGSICCLYQIVFLAALTPLTFRPSGSASASASASVFDFLTNKTGTKKHPRGILRYNEYATISEGNLSIINPKTRLKTKITDRYGTILSFAKRKIPLYRNHIDV